MSNPVTPPPAPDGDYPPPVDRGPGAAPGFGDASQGPGGSGRAARPAYDPLSQPSQPGYDALSYDSLSRPAQPSYPHAASGGSTYPPQTQPGYPQPGYPVAPAQPDYPAAPNQPGYAAPGQQGYAAPGQPGYAAPGQPGYAAPGQPGYAAPGQPGYAAPGQPGYAAPGQPGYAAPGPQGYAAPGQGEGSAHAAYLQGAKPVKKSGPTKLLLRIGVAIVITVVGFFVRSLLRDADDKAKDAAVGDCIASSKQITSTDAATDATAKVVDCSSADAAYTVVARVDGETDVESKSCDRFFKADEPFFVYAADNGVHGYLLCLKPRR